MNSLAMPLYLMKIITIHLKWRKEVVLNYDKLREESNHIEAYKARHRYTNYGWIWKKNA